MSRIDRAFLIEECAWSLTATRVRSPRPSPRRARPTSRATVRADRLPADPPETNTPPAPAGSPARSAMSRSTWFSAAIAPAASRAEIPWMLEPDTSMSNSRAAFVGAAGMNARKFEASELITCGASTSVHISITRCGSVPSAVIRPSSCAVSAGTSPGRSRGTGSIAMRSCMAVRTMRVSRSSCVCMSRAMGAHRSGSGSVPRRCAHPPARAGAGGTEWCDGRPPGWPAGASGATAGPVRVPGFPSDRWCAMMGPGWWSARGHRPGRGRLVA